MNILRIKERDTIYKVTEFPLLIITDLKHDTGWRRYTLKGDKLDWVDPRYNCYILFPITCEGEKQDLLRHGSVELRINGQNLQLATKDGIFQN
jgi:hypothetical protein